MPLGGKELFATAFSGDYYDEMEAIHHNILKSVLPFFFPTFKREWGNFPDIEEFCTLVVSQKDLVNLLFANGYSEIKDNDYYHNIIDGIKSRLGVFFTEKQRDIGSNFKNIENFISRLKKDDTIITFNYDSLLERAIVKRNGPNKISYLKDPDRISILKLHGSITWFHKDNYKYLRPQNPQLFTDPLKDIYYIKDFIPVYSRFVTFKRHTLIEPTYFKKPDIEILKAVWTDSKEVLINTDEIIIIGYSMPEGDFSARCLLQYMNNLKKKKISVINPNGNLKYRFEQAFGEIEFIETTFELSEYGRPELNSRTQ